ncbi:MAG: hypothetical protein GXN99_03340 [Candidatus Nanohaloarchaeota archaeon]|nr:hypothetical protein [Candidatus Nanohaloarchaeota archaeon]
MDYEWLLEGDYYVSNEQGKDVILFADFGKAGFKRASSKISSVWRSLPQQIAAYGILGSVRGIHLVIRNSLALPNVNRIILVGKEIMPFFSFSAISLLHKNGASSSGRINGFREYVKEIYGMMPLIDDVDLDEDILFYFQKFIELQWINDLSEYRPKDDKEYYDFKSREDISKKVRELNVQYNRKKSLFKTRSNVMVGSHIYEESIEDAHKLALMQIMFSGHETDSQYGKTKELINLMITVKNPYDEVFSNKLYEDYGKDLVSPSLESEAYTYGRLLCQYEGFNQIDAIIQRLKNNLEDRAALASLWMPKKHLTDKSNQPCLDLVHVLVRNNKVNLTAYIRSNDMFKAWPVNVAGLAYINHYIWQNLSADYPDLELGYVTTISSSAHIYESDWKQALEKAMSYEKDFVQDKFGYFVLSRESKTYVAKVYENSGKLLGEVKDECAVSLRKKLVRMFSLTSEHASYIGEVLEGLRCGEEKLVDK